MVRRFATWLHARDHLTEVPPYGALPARRRRRRPHIFTDDEVRRLMAEAAHQRSRTGLRFRKFICEDQEPNSHCGRDHDARLRRRRPAERPEKAAHARIPRGEAVIVDEVLPDGHGVAAPAERLGD
jgi:hypothetical protein